MSVAGFVPNKRASSSNAERVEPDLFKIKGVPWFNAKWVKWDLQSPRGGSAFV